MATRRPKASEMTGFGNNWDTGEVVESVEEGDVYLQQRLQGERSEEERSERGGISSEAEENKVNVNQNQQQQRIMLKKK